MSAIHKRLYFSMKEEFKLLAKIISTYLPPEYPYDVVGAARTIKQIDFDDRIDILTCRGSEYFLDDAENYFSTNRITISNV